MAASDTLSELATRAKIVDERVSLARDEARAQLQAQVDEARRA